MKRLDCVSLLLLCIFCSRKYLNELLNDSFHSRCGLCTTNGKKRREKLRYSNISFDSY